MDNPINLLVDYKDRAGRYYHNAFQAFNAASDAIAGACVMERLRQGGFIPCAVVAVHGCHSLDELEQIQSRPPRPGEGRLLYLDRDEY